MAVLVKRHKGNLLLLPLADSASTGPACHHLSLYKIYS